MRKSLIVGMLVGARSRTVAWGLVVERPYVGVLSRELG